MGSIPSTFHVKVKFHTKQGITIVRGNQQVARQCLVAAVNREIKQKALVEEEMGASGAEDVIQVRILSDDDRNF